MPYAFVQGAIESARPAADARGVRLEATLDPAAGPVSGDANRLQQVAWNLISNAIKFTPRGGHVQVTFERVNSKLKSALPTRASVSSRISFRTSRTLSSG